MRLGIIALLLSARAFAQYPAVDYFQRATLGTNLTTVGSATWTMDTSKAIRVSSTNVRGWRARTLGGQPGNDQCVEVLLDSGWAARGSASRGGVGLRINTSAITGYGVEVQKSGSTQYFLRILKYDGTTETTITSNSPQTVTPALNDRLRACVVGTSITGDLLQGKTGATTRLTQVTGTDATYTSGYLGHWAYATNVKWYDAHYWTSGQTEPLRAWPPESPGHPLYVSTTGTANGTGTKANPLTANWLCSKLSTISGVNVVVRGGTYTADDKLCFHNAGSVPGYFQLLFSGTIGSPQTVSAYPGEKPIFDAAVACSSGITNGTVAMVIGGSYGQSVGIEVRNSLDDKVTCGAINCVDGVNVLGTQTFFRRGVIRDVQQGVSAFNHTGGGVTDSIFKNTGRRKVGVSSGLNYHHAYSHNTSTGTLRLVNNFFLHQMADATGGQSGQIYCWQHYSQSGQDVKNTDSIGNVMAKCGGYIAAQGGAGGVSSNIRVENNSLFKLEAQFQKDNILTSNFDVKNNWLDGGTLLRYGGGGGSEFTGNTMSCSGCSSQSFRFQVPNNASYDDINEAWDAGFNNNTYHQMASAASNTFEKTITGSAATYLTFPNWKLQTGSPDAASTLNTTIGPAFGVTLPDAGATNAIRTSTSEDEPLRGTVAVYNWKGLSSGINLQLSTLGYASGDEYEIVDAQNLAGGAIASGVYSGATIDLGPHMGLTAVDAPIDTGYTIDPTTMTGCSTTPTGSPTPAFTHTTSLFATFLVQRKQTLRSVNVSLTNPVASSTRATLRMGPSSTDLSYPPVTATCATSAVCNWAVDHFAGKVYYAVDFKDASATLDSTVPLPISISTAFSGVVNDTFASPTAAASWSTGAAVVTVTTTSLPGATNTQTTYSQTLAATGGTAPYTWAVSTGAIPTGLSLSSAGVITGTNSAAGTFNFSVIATDSLSVASSPQALSIVVAAAPAITTTTLPGGTVGTLYTGGAISTSGGVPALTCAVQTGTIPAGLTLASLCSTGLTGTPSTATTYNFTVRATDINGVFDDQALSIVVAAGGGSSGTLTVCNAGPPTCGYATAQAALDASADGATILLTAAENHGPLVIPGGRHDLTIKSNLIDNWAAANPGYRIPRSDPALARLTGVTAGSFGKWVTGTVSSATLATATPHGFAVNDQVVIGVDRYSGFHCAALNQTPYAAECTSGRVGFFNIRRATGFVNGTILRFKGRTLPSPLATATDYYVINFSTVGGIDQFQLSLTPGGAPVSVPQFNPVGQDLIIEEPPLPRQIGDVMYVVSVPTTTSFTLSTSLGGAATTWLNFPRGYDGSSFSDGLNVYKIAPIYNITFDGLENAPTTDAGVFYPFNVSVDAGNAAGENYNIKIYRSWLRGADDQEAFPNTTLKLGAKDSEVGWSVIEGAYSVHNDTQGIGFVSTGGINIHDSEIKGAAEGIMSGGNVPWFAFGTNTTGVTVSRNYLWKPLKAHTGMWAISTTGTTFYLANRTANAGCDTVAADLNLSNRCFVYESDETDPAAATVTRFEWTASIANSTFSAVGTTGQKGFLYVLGGVLKMDHNFSGSVSCPAGVTCTVVATPVFPAASTRIGIAVVGAGNVFDGNFYTEMRSVYSKNHIESKYGDNWLIEGNVFHRQNNCDSGNSCQDPAIQFTVAANGSNVGEPVNYSASSSDSIIRKNMFRHMSAGVVGVGLTFLVAGIHEWTGFGRNQNNLVENNLFIDLGSTEYGNANINGAMVRQQDTKDWIVQHNTAVDVRDGFALHGATAPVDSPIYRSNILTPYRSACLANPADCADPEATTHIGAQNTTGLGPFPLVHCDSGTSYQGCIGNGSIIGTPSFLNNLLMNQAGYVYNNTRASHYTSTTWQVQHGDANRNPATLFTTWAERDNSVAPNGLHYRAANFRLAPGMAAPYPGHGPKEIGADIDEIEALTGRNGIDVERGWPKFSDRTSRLITPSSTSAAMSYLTNGSTCTIKVWPNENYSGTATFDGAGTATAASITGLAGSTAYYGKRWCGTEVDVFSFTTSFAAAPTTYPYTFSFHLPTSVNANVAKARITITRAPLADVVSTVTGSVPIVVAPFDIGSGVNTYKIDYLDAANALLMPGDAIPYQFQTQ